MNKLHVLERATGGVDGCRGLDESSPAGSIHVRSPQLASCRSVVLATERMDDDPAWGLVEPGELLHVPPDLECVSRSIIDRPPAQQLTLHDLDQRAAASQTADTGATSGSKPDGIAGVPSGPPPDAPAARPGGTRRARSRHPRRTPGCRAGALGLALDQWCPRRRRAISWRVDYQPRARHSEMCGRSAPRVESFP